MDCHSSTPIWVNIRSRGSSSLPRSSLVLQPLALIFFLGVTVSTATPTLTDPHFPAIFTFGDSNSDTGAKSAAFDRIPYPNGETYFHRASGRYCDGKIILDFIVEKLGLPCVNAYLDSMGMDFRHGANFAVGGSTIQPVDERLFGAGYSPFSLEVQLLQFKQFKARIEETFNEDLSSFDKTRLPRPEDFSKALYTLDIGQNDIDFGLKTSTVDELKAFLPKIVGMLAHTVKELYKLGGRMFWIQNTGPFGCLPYAIIRFTSKPEDIDQNGCIKSLNGVAEEFNRLLMERVYNLKAELVDSVIVYVDVYSVKYSLISEAKKHGFHDPFGYCCGHYGDNNVLCWTKTIVNGTVIDVNVCEDPSKYISWDGIHYSHSANKWVASEILEGFSFAY